MAAFSSYTCAYIRQTLNIVNPQPVSKQMHYVVLPMNYTHTILHIVDVC